MGSLVEPRTKIILEIYILDVHVTQKGARLFCVICVFEYYCAGNRCHISNWVRGSSRFLGYSPVLDNGHTI